MAETNQLRTRLEALLDSNNENVNRYLFTIRSAEHGDKVQDPDRYSRAFGNRVIPDLSKYNEDFLVPFKQTDGRTNKTSAQGAYQAIKPTWTRIAARLGLTDFSPRSQDLFALALLDENRSLPDVIKGDFGSALQKDGGTWASLPSSRYPQPRQKLASIAGWLGVPVSKSHDSGGTGGFMLADGRTVTGDTPEETAKLMKISESRHSDSTKTRMVDVLAKLPKTATSDTRDLLQSDLPTELDNDLRRLIEIA